MHPPKPQNPPDSALETAPVAPRDVLQIPLQGCHCENGPGAIALCRFLPWAVPPDRSLSPLAVNDIQAVPLRQDAPGGRGLYPSQTLRRHQPDHLLQASPLLAAIAARSGFAGSSLPKREFAPTLRNQPLPLIACRNGHNAPFPADFRFNKPPPIREVIEIPVHGYNITSTLPDRPVSRSSSLSRVSRPGPCRCPPEQCRSADRRTGWAG